MKKNYFKNYRKTVSLGVISLITVTVIGTAVFAGSNDNGKSDNKNKCGVTMTAGGIASVFENAGNSITTKNDDGSFSGGIASVMSNYYINENPSTLTVSNIDRVLKLLPDQNEEQQPDTAASQPEAVTQPEPAPEPAKVQSVLPEYTNLGVSNVDNYLNIREEPNLNGKVLGKLPTNAGCEILEETNGWYKITSGDLTGYVAAEFILTGEQANQRASQSLCTVARVNADKLMVREEANTNSSILTKVAAGEELEAIEILDGWVKVNIDNVQGYVCADYVTVYQTLPKGVTVEELSVGGNVSSTAVDLIEYAKQFLGNPYVWGGTSLTNGADCSGFTMRIFEHFGYSLSRTSGAQSNNGTRVSLSEIQPGDLLFYNHGSSIGHVAIYIGNGQIIHASTERTGIIISNAFYTTPACATRIIE